MSAWTDHVRFTWGWGEDFLDAKTLKETLELSAAELYEFLAFVLRQHLLKRRQRDEWSAVAYQPALNNSQLDAFAKQISRFQSEDPPSGKMLCLFLENTFIQIWSPSPT